MNQCYILDLADPFNELKSLFGSCWKCRIAGSQWRAVANFCCDDAVTLRASTGSRKIDGRSLPQSRVCSGVASETTMMWLTVGQGTTELLSGKNLHLSCYLASPNGMYQCEVAITGLHSLSRIVAAKPGPKEMGKVLGNGFQPWE